MTCECLSYYKLHSEQISIANMLAFSQVVRAASKTRLTLTYTHTAGCAAVADSKAHV